MENSLTIQFNFWVAILGFGALQGYFFSAILLVQKKGNRRANRWLAVFVLLTAYYLTVQVVQISGLYIHFPYVIGTGSPFWYLLGPLMFFYVKFLLDNSARFSFWHLLHIIPFLNQAYKSLFFYALPGEKKVAAFQRFIATPAGFSWDYLIISILLLSYLFVCIRMLKRAEKKFRNHSATTQSANITWFKRLLTAFTIYVVFDSIIGTWLAIHKLDSTPLFMTTNVMMATFVQIVAYTAALYPEKLFAAGEVFLTLNQNGENGEGKFLPGSMKKKYQNSALSPEDAGLYLEKLRDLMKDEQPHLNSDLKLPDLAKMLDISPHNLSQLLNQEVGLSFYDFINEYRIKEAQKRLLDPTFKDYTILAIALDSGFHSKTSFNRMFKKCTNLTPSEYIKKYSLISKNITTIDQPNL